MSATAPGTGRPGPPAATTTSEPAAGAAGAARAGLPTGPEKTALVRSMFDTIAPRYDLVNRMMTFGLDLRWRRGAARALGLPPGSRVLDLACGTGDFLAIAGSVGLVPFGLDLSWGMLAADHSGRPRAQADGSALPVGDGAVDGITCGYALRNFTDLGAVFSEMGRVVRPGGRISLLEVAEPEGGLLRAGHRLWFRHLVPVLGGLVSDAAAYRYLPTSTAYLPPTPELRSMLASAGFSAVNQRPLSGGLSQLITATRRGRR
jgi:demethylmenaquinone methyltransferase/2-methoxy-6-polyprenyl-1,4-benzoquinol methylase